MPKQAERLFLSLKVGEISLVDEPANEKQIIVAKRKEQQEMTTEAAAQTPTETSIETAETTDPAVTKTADAEVVQTEIDDGTPDEVVEALKSLVANVTSIATSKGGGKKESKAGPGKLPPFLKAMEAKLKAAGATPDAITQALNAAKAAFGPSGLAADEPKKTTTQKVAEPESTPQVSEDELVMKVLESISKAKSFTPGRIKKLVQAIGNLDSLLEELGIDKASFGASGLAATGTAATPSPPVMDTAASGGAGKPGNAIRKDAAGEQPSGLTADGIAQAVAKALEPLTQQITEVTERVDSIEKARTPSTQPGGGEGDGNETATQKNKSIWTGVL